MLLGQTWKTIVIRLIMNSIGYLLNWVKQPLLKGIVTILMVFWNKIDVEKRSYQVVNVLSLFLTNLPIRF